jgi:hypothetical protein
MLLLLISCTFIGGYNADAHQNLTSLKAAHIKMINDVTAAPGHVYDRHEFDAAVDSLELKFQEAIEFSRSLNEQWRTANIMILHSIFSDDVEAIRRGRYVLSREQANRMRDVSGPAYDRAIIGECAHPEAKCK